MFRCHHPAKCFLFVKIRVIRGLRHFSPSSLTPMRGTCTAPRPPPIRAQNRRPGPGRPTCRVDEKLKAESRKLKSECEALFHLRTSAFICGSTIFFFQIQNPKFLFPWRPLRLGGVLQCFGVSVFRCFSKSREKARCVATHPFSQLSAFNFQLSTLPPVFRIETRRR